MTTDRSFVEGADLVLTPIPLRNRRAVLPRVTATLLALQVPFAAAALVVAGGDGDPPSLAEAAARTDDVDQLRFAMYVSADIPGEDSFDDMLLMTGEEDGDRQHFVLDFREMAESVGEENDGFTDMGVGMEMILTPDRLYLRTPMFAAIDAEVDEPMPPFAQPLIDLGDRWGWVELTTLAGLANIDPSALSESQTMDLDGALALLRVADGEVEHRGRGEVRDVAVDELRTTIAFSDLMETEGIGAAMAEDYLPAAGAAGLDPAAVLEALRDVEVQIDVAIDDDDVVRRVELTLDEELFEAMADLLGAPGGFGATFEMGMAIEIFDLGDESIDVEEPSGDVVDLNGSIADLVQLFGG